MANCRGNNWDGANDHEREGNKRGRGRWLGAEKCGGRANMGKDREEMGKGGEGILEAVEKHMANRTGAQRGDLDIVGSEWKSRDRRVANVAVGDLAAARGKSEAGSMASATGSDLGICGAGANGERERDLWANDAVDDGNGVCKVWARGRGECKGGAPGRWQLCSDNVWAFQLASGWGLAISHTVGDDSIGDVAKRGRQPKESADARWADAVCAPGATGDMVWSAPGAR